MTTPYSRADLAAADDLIRLFGRGAGDEAVARAGRSRTIGNHIHFCRWRQVGRLIAVLGATAPIGTIH